MTGLPARPPGQSAVLAVPLARAVGIVVPTAAAMAGRDGRGPVRLHADPAADDTRPTLLAVALGAQAVHIALPALAGAGIAAMAWCSATSQSTSASASTEISALPPRQRPPKE